MSICDICHHWEFEGIRRHNLSKHGKCHLHNKCTFDYQSCEKYMRKFDHTDTPLITCPYCGKQDPYSCDKASWDEFEVDCECGKYFKCKSVVTVTWDSWKVDQNAEG